MTKGLKLLKLEARKRENPKSVISSGSVKNLSAMETEKVRKAIFEHYKLTNYMKNLQKEGFELIASASTNDPRLSDQVIKDIESHHKAIKDSLKYGKINRDRLR